METSEIIKQAPNTVNQHVDTLIIGGGCAGLSLTSALIEQGYAGTIAIIESRKEYVDDRSWCVWSDANSCSIPGLSQRWASWNFNADGHSLKTRSGDGLSYDYIRSLDFYNNSISNINNSKNTVLRLNEAVEKIECISTGWLIKTNKNSTTCKYLIDTRPPPQEILLKSILFQCFIGYEIELNCAMPETELCSANVMTQMRLVEGEFCFNYILPLSPTRLLVEITFFSRKPVNFEIIQKELDFLLQHRGWASALIIRKEASILPMGLPAMVDDHPSSRIRAGIGGGALRPSSSYGFLRIQQWSKLCAKQLCIGNSPRSHLQERTFVEHILNFMDVIFLNVIYRYPTLSPLIFERLFGNVPTQSFIRFMTDRPKFVDIVCVIAALPKIPFLSVLFRPRIKK